MKQQTLRRMLGYVRPYRGQLALACTAALLSVLFTLLAVSYTHLTLPTIRLV